MKWENFRVFCSEKGTKIPIRNFTKSTKINLERDTNPEAYLKHSQDKPQSFSYHILLSHNLITRPLV